MRVCERATHPRPHNAAQPRLHFPQNHSGSLLVRGIRVAFEVRKKASAAVNTVTVRRVCRYQDSQLLVPEKQPDLILYRGESGVDSMVTAKPTTILSSKFCSFGICG